MGYVKNESKEAIRVQGIDFEPGETKQLADYICEQVIRKEPDVMKPATQMPERKPRAKSKDTGGVKNG